MSKVCAITGKVVVDGKPQTIRISARALKTLKRKGTI